MAMRREIKQTSKQIGAAAIEFAIGSFAFFLMCFYVIEMGYMSYVTSVSDLAIAQATRQARLVDVSTVNSASKDSGSAFMVRFRSVITQSDKIWSGLIDPNKFVIRAYYFQGFSDIPADLADATCHESYEDEELSSGGDDDCMNNAALAIYQVDYAYQPILNQFLVDDLPFKRETIVVQEYEREQFKF